MAGRNLPPSTTALRVFLAVARLGSTAKAAGEVHLTQSAVSKQIQALEDHLGTELFERSPADREAARALKANYPGDYQQLLRRVADASQARGSEAATRETSQFMERFIRSKANAIIAAPDRELQRIGGGQVALIQALRDENVNLCAQYAVRGLTPGTRLSPATIQLLSRLSVFVIEAAQGDRAGEQ